MSQVFSSNFYANSLYGYQAKVEGETITLTPKNKASFFRKIKSHLFFQPSPNSIAVSQKLAQLLKELEKPESEKAQKLTEEIHQTGLVGYYRLKSTIRMLNKQFEIENNKSKLAHLLLPTINIVRKSFRLKPLAKQKHQLIPTSQYEKVLDNIKGQAFELTPEEKANAQFSLDVLSPTIPETLQPQHFNKLEYGFLENISFSYAEYQFHLHYYPDSKSFYLSLYAHTHQTEPSDKKHHVKIEALEQGIKRQGQFWIAHEFKERPKQTTFLKTIYRATTSGSLELKPNSEYTLSVDGHPPFKFALKQKD